jgi:2-polyprenyl-3-methyl-5-hydroxy-6-metoxy-1,4-benzoquinol methylase
MQDLTARQWRERDFYTEYSQKHRDEDVVFDPVLGHEKRPWNSYWRFYQVIQDAFQSPSQRLLDFGCGWGNASMIYSHIGYQVAGFDVCEDNVIECRRKAEKYGFSDRTNFSVQTAEDLSYADESFDVVAGLDILHHVGVEPALRGARRVLKPGGIAVFREFLVVPVFDAARKSSFGTWLVPNEASIDDHRTEDEEKLNPMQVEIVKSVFPQHELIRFNLFARFRRFFPNPNPGRPSKIEKLDQVMFRALPVTQRFGGDAVMILHK